MTESPDSYILIRKRLHRLRQKSKRVHLVCSSLRFLCTMVCLATAASMIEHLLYLPPAAKTILLITAASAATVITAVLLFIPLADLLFRKESPSEVDLALIIGSRFPAVRDRLADSLDVFQKNSRTTSRSLAVQALNDAVEEVADIPFQDAATDPVCRKRLTQAARAGGFCLVLWLIFGGSLAGALNRLAEPGRRFVRPRGYTLTVSPADTTVMQGANVVITAAATGSVPVPLLLHVSRGSTPERQHRLGSNRRFTLAGVRKKTVYRLTAGGMSTRKFTIDIREYPDIRTIQAAVTPPAYSGEPQKTLPPDEGDITALKGAYVQLQAEMNKPLRRASLEFESGKTMPMAVNGTSVSGGFRCVQNDRYIIRLEDSLGNTNVKPVSYTVMIREDFPPAAAIILPGEHRDLDETMEVRLAANAEDDYGLTRAAIRYTVYRKTAAGDTSLQRLDIPADFSGTPVVCTIEYLWKLDGLNLLPEDIINYRLEVWDNDAVSGPKSGLSASYTLRFPSIEEILAEVDKGHRRQTSDLENILDQGRQLQQQLERAGDMLKSGRKMSWEQTHELQKSLLKQKKTLSGIDSLKEKLDTVVDKLQKQDLLSLETMQKYQEMQRLYQEIDSPELRKAMKKLEQQLAHLDPEAVRQAAEQMKHRQEQLIAALERTIQLLKQLKLEQQLESLINTSADMLRDQGRINKELSSPEAEDAGRTASQEGRISRDAAYLESALQELSKELSTQERMPESLLDPALQHLQQNRIDSLAAAVSGQIERGDYQQALAGGVRITEQLEQLKTRLEQARSKMQQSTAGKSSAAARRAVRRLLAISREQEALADTAVAGTIDLPETARRQWSLKHALEIEADSLAALTLQSFFLDAGIARSLGEALTFMERTVTTLSQERKPAVNLQKLAMASLNRTIVLMLRSLEKMAANTNQSNMSAMEQLMKGLEQMSVEQMGINRRTIDMLNKGQLTPEQQAAMSRLSAEQEVLRKTLEGMLKNFGKQENLLGDLSRIIDDMQETADKLARQEPDTQLIQRQQQILSRLLDARHALRSDELSRERKAVSAEDIIRQSPSEFKGQTDTILDMLNQDILRMSKEGFSEDYLELVRRYYRSLARERSLLETLRKQSK